MRTGAIEPDITAADTMKLLTLRHPGRAAPIGDGNEEPADAVRGNPHLGAILIIEDVAHGTSSSAKLRITSTSWSWANFFSVRAPRNTVSTSVIVLPGTFGSSTIYSYGRLGLGRAYRERSSSKLPMNQTEHC
jgi:hypothetical protein